MRFALCLIATLLVPLAAQAEILSLRCTITPKASAQYSGYVWIDLQARRAYEQWYREGVAAPGIEGPFRVLMAPNDMTITDSLAPKGNVRLRIDRASGSGTASDGSIFCVTSDVKLPIKPPPAKR